MEYQDPYEPEQEDLEAEKENKKLEQLIKVSFIMFFILTVLGFYAVFQI